MGRRRHGNAHYNKNEILHVKSFQNVDGSLCKQDPRTRFAYLVVSKADALEAAGSLEDDKAVVDAVKGTYTATLLKGIKEEKSAVSKKPELKDKDYVIDKKLVSLFSVPACNVTSEAMALKAKKFNAAYNTLDASKKVSGSKRNVSYLHKTREDCRETLVKEHIELKLANPEPDMCQPYALISVPYVFNAVYSEDGAKSYQCTSYEIDVCVSLMPKVRVEYGVFFDGTNNNMYNIDFYQDYKKFMMQQSKAIRENAEPYKTGRDFPIDEKVDPINYIATHPDPDKDPKVMKNLRNQIVSDMRYFEQSSTVKNRYNDDKASKDADKVFDFLKEVRDTVTEKDESLLEVGLEKYVRGYESVTGTAEEIKDFLVENILPDDDDGSSYVNGYTNIKRLYEHYEGSDRLARKKADQYDLKHFKLYASGSGTVDPIDNEKLDGDDMIGLGLGEGIAGVKAHVVYACEKIAEEIRAAGIEHVDELVLDVFGFSRGATEARHFVCAIQERLELLNQDGYVPYTLSAASKNIDIFTPFYEEDDGRYIVIGGKSHPNPLRPAMPKVNHRGRPVSNNQQKKPPLHIANVAFRHVNIGDTVTHHGFKQSDDFEELSLRFDPDKTGSVFHIMAMDEYRNNFDAYSIFDDDYGEVKREEGNKFKEVVVPGAHADVGGGYETSGPDETVHLAGYAMTTSKSVSAWNDLYGWFPVEKPEEKTKVYSISRADTMGKPGFYDVSDHYSPSEVDYHDIYMRRTNLSWLYELVTLRLMHAEAVDKLRARDEEDRVPLAELLPKYDLVKLAEEGTITTEEKKFLMDTVHRTLAKGEALEVEEHKKLRQRYMHHSSSLGIVNGPSQDGNEKRKDEIYGRRSIYGAAGDDFSLLPGLAAKLARRKV